MQLFQEYVIVSTGLAIATMFANARRVRIVQPQKLNHTPTSRTNSMKRKHMKKHRKPERSCMSGYTTSNIFLGVSVENSMDHG